MDMENFEFVMTLKYENGVTNVYRLKMTEEERQRNREAAARAAVPLLYGHKKKAATPIE